MKITTQLASPLAKIFPETDMTTLAPFKSFSTLKNERFSFQLAYLVDEHWGGFMDVKVESELEKYIKVRRVESAPVRFTAYFHDDDVISNKPGLYPDILEEFDGAFRIPFSQWRSLWIDVDVPSKLAAGKYPIKIELFNRDNPAEKSSKTFTLEVLDVTLPKQKLIATLWFHADCLATYYNVPVWSEEHWKIVENAMCNMTEHGINMLLTPVFTPPLDTAVGGERPTTQLVGVKVVGKDKYEFDFSKLERWLDLAKKSGIEYIEISHLFTQWGAAFCPKIVADVKGKEERIFGWDVESTSAKYTKFLDAFLPELVKLLKKRKLAKNTYFHCSDEPHADHIETYAKAVAILRKHLDGFKICDALSNVEFYKNGLVTTPIPAEDHIEPFVEAGVENLWTYYCCGQINKVSNRMLHMPSSRNRIMGALMYRYNIAGFLQWGLNFYHSQHSLFPIDPYQVQDSNYAFPAGDPFIVYPGKDGKMVDSLRFEVFAQGIRDMSALQLLEEKIGRDKVTAMLDRMSPDRRMTMTEYPRGEKAVLAMRKKINDLLK